MNKPALMRFLLLPCTLINSSCENQRSQNLVRCDVRIGSVCISSDHEFDIERTWGSHYLIYNIVNDDEIVEAVVVSGFFGTSPDFGPVVCPEIVRPWQHQPFLTGKEFKYRLEDDVTCSGEIIIYRDNVGTRDIDVDIVER